MEHAEKKIMSKSTVVSAELDMQVISAHLQYMTKTQIGNVETPWIVSNKNFANEGTDPQYDSEHYHDFVVEISYLLNE